MISILVNWKGKLTNCIFVLGYEDKKKLIETICFTLSYVCCILYLVCYISCLMSYIVLLKCLTLHGLEIPVCFVFD